jgi:uncharacterized Zn finger protein
MSHDDIMYQKARYLIESGRVEFLDHGVYNVIGEHGTYNVVVDYTGKISCTCPGFLQKGNCSHAQAVALLKKKRPRRPR